ncbi:MAG: YacL family protein [Aeromonadaceae bacterium]
MDYEFIREPDGRLKANLSMGHEAVGHWLNDEVGTNLALIEAVLADIDAVLRGEQETVERHGAVYTLHLGDEEAEIAANVVQFEFADDLEPDMAYYDDEQMAGCGLADFHSLLLAWLDFVRTEQA